MITAIWIFIAVSLLYTTLVVVQVQSRINDLLKQYWEVRDETKVCRDSTTKISGDHILLKELVESQQVVIRALKVKAAEVIYTNFTLHRLNNKMPVNPKSAYELKYDIVINGVTYCAGQKAMVRLQRAEMFREIAEMWNSFVMITEDGKEHDIDIENLINWFVSEQDHKQRQEKANPKKKK